MKIMLVVIVAGVLALGLTGAVPAPAPAPGGLNGRPLSPDVAHRAMIEQNLAAKMTAFPNVEFTDPDCGRDPFTLITSKGYPAEYHEVLTDDGYILGVFRIPSGRGETKLGAGPRPVAFLQHGLEGSCNNWISNLANQSLAYLLADAGIDVWLGNVRGNTYSRKHSSLSTQSADFWKFSWDEMAAHDIPAMVNYVLASTGNSQIYYVGHSQGTLVGFAQFSEDLEFAKKIKMFFALAPVAHVGNIKSPIRTLAPYVDPINILAQIVGMNEFLPSLSFINSWASKTCSLPQDQYAWLCQDLTFLLMTHKLDLLNVSRIPVYMAHSPGGTSTQNFAHFGQMVNSNKMQKYDYGMMMNLLKYKQTTPPEYHPERMEVPTVIFHGSVDNLADPTDVAWLLPLIKNKVADYNLPNYGHMDFIWALTAPTDIYEPIIQLINKNEAASVHH